MTTNPLPRQFALDLSQPPKASLENYLPGKDHALVSTLKILCQSWKKTSEQINNPLNHRWIYWWGPAGSGRSHLLSAMTNTAESFGIQYFSLYPKEPTAWVRVEEKMSLLASAECPSLIAVDDVECLDERLQAALFRILNGVHASKNMCILMSGNSAPATLNLREDLRTRLGWGLVFQTQLLTDDEKILALEQAAKARGLVLSPEVLPWLLNRFYRDMPNLMALIEALDAYSLETKRAVTLPLVRELLQAK